MRPPALVVLAGALCSAPIAPEWTRPPRSLEPQQPNDADGRYPKPDEVASPKRELSGRSSEPPPMPKLPSGNAVTNVTTALGAESEDDPGVPASVINGNADGTLNEAPWNRTVRALTALGIPSVARVPSAFCDSAGYKSACGSKCPESESTDMHHVRGCMFAHRRALQAFVNTTAERFFVFEDDVTLPDAPLAWSRAATSEFVAAAKGKDLGYLGHCFDGLCTHALLWSRAGAQKALSRVRWCTSQPVDEQLRQLCWDKQLECTLAPNARVTRRTWGDGLLHQWAKECGDPYECAARKIEESKAHKNSREVAWMALAAGRW